MAPVVMLSGLTWAMSPVNVGNTTVPVGPTASSRASTTASGPPSTRPMLDSDECTRTQSPGARPTSTSPRRMSARVTVGTFPCSDFAFAIFSPRENGPANRQCPLLCRTSRGLQGGFGRGKGSPLLLLPSPSGRARVREVPRPLPSRLGIDDAAHEEDAARHVVADEEDERVVRPELDDATYR